MKNPTQYALSIISTLLYVLIATTPIYAATITVGTVGDTQENDGFCTLREALANADDDFVIWADCIAGNGDDDIVFDPSLFSGSPPTATVTLNPVLGFIRSFASDAITITAPADSRIVLVGDGSFPLLDIQGVSRDVTLSNLDLRDAGGGNFAAMRLVSSGNVQLQGLRFINNHGGGLFIDTVGTGSLTLTDCLFTGNTRDGSGFRDDGGAMTVFLGDDFDITISDCRFEGNSVATRTGGALFIDTSSWNGGSGTAQVDIGNTIFRDNSAAFDGGALHATSNNNDAQFVLTLTDTLFDSNRSSQGGGAVTLFARDQTAVRADIIRSSFVGNSSLADGGALRMVDHNVTLINSVFSANQAEQGGALSYRLGNTSVPHELNLIGNTFDSNLASLASGGQAVSIHLFNNPTGWQWVWRGNAISPGGGQGNSAGNADPQCARQSASALTFANAGNLFSDASCAFDASDNVADPQLVSAVGNTALKPVLLFPSAGSPAIDGWLAADCLNTSGGALTTDHLDNPRPRDGDASGPVDCDAGAFEVGDAGAVTVTVSGSGRVVSEPAGIDCTNSCQTGFPGGQALVLTAIADIGSVFDGFSGTCSGTEQCNLVVDGNATVNAIFSSAPSSQLDVLVTGDGQGRVISNPSGIACEPLCSASFANSTTVTLTANPDFDAAFDGWSGAGCTGTNPCQVTLNTDTQVSASFSATAFILDLNLVGSGTGSVSSTPSGINCLGDCAELFDRSTVVTLTANANSGSEFIDWEGVSCPAGPVTHCELDMNDGPFAVDARFESLVEITAQTSGNGTGIVVSSPAGISCPGTCSALFPIGTNLTLTPQASAGATFTSWDDLECGSFGNQPCVVSILSAFTADAVFQSAGFQLSVQIDGQGTVVSSPGGINCPDDCSEIFSSTTPITLSAQPAPGQVFAGWSGLCSGRGACLVSLNTDGEAVAQFRNEVIFKNGFEP